MGKNKQPRDQAPNPSSVANREIFQRLNFLYQASAYLKGLETPMSAPAPREGVEQPGGGRARKRGGKRRKGTLGELGSSYVRCMRIIGNKTVVRMDPSVKRTLCKGCDTVLVSGVTASVRIRGSHMGHKVTYTCLTCHRSLAIPAPPVAIGPGPADPSLAPMSATSLQNPLEATQTPASDPPQMQSRQYKNEKRKPPMPRPLPLFARPDAGHVVFRGNDALTESWE